MYSLHLMSNNSIKGHFGLRNTIAAVKLVNLKARKVSATSLKWSISNTAHVEFFSITFSVVETLHMFKGGTEASEIYSLAQIFSYCFVNISCVTIQCTFSRNNATGNNSLTDNCFNGFIDLACVDFRSLFLYLRYVENLVALSSI